MNDSMGRRKWSAKTALLLLVALAATLRLYKLGSNSFWVDEFATLRISSLSLKQIVAENIGNQSFEPPLYFWLIHGILRLFGGSEAALRLPSALAGTLTVPVLWLLVREITESRVAAWLSAALLSLNPLHLWYSQEARPYALLILFSGLAILCLARAVQRNSRVAWFGFGGWTLIAVFTHAVGLLLLAVAWSWAITGANRRLLTPLVTCSVLVLACAAPLTFAIVQVSKQRPGNGSPERPVDGLEIPYTLFTYVGGYSFGPSLREIQNEGARAAVAAHPVESGIVVATLGALAVLLLRNPWPPLLTPLFLLNVGLAFLAAAATGKAYSVRYALPGLIGFLAVIAVALVRTSPTVRLAWASLLLSVFAWSDRQWFYHSIYAKDNSRELVQWLGKRLPAGSLVQVAPGYEEGLLSYYSDREHVHMHFGSVETRSCRQAMAALVMTRLHHVGDPESIKASFRRANGIASVEDTVGGYIVLTSPKTRAQSGAARELAPATSMMR